MNISPINSMTVQNVQKQTPLSIFYMNDIHGNISNFGKLKTAHDSFMSKHKNTNNLTVASGDIFIGRDKQRNNMFVNFMNKLGVKFFALGNHEFDAGSDKLADRLENANFTTVSTNIEVDKKSKLAERIQENKLVKSAVCMQNGTKFAILGTSPVDEKNIDKMNKTNNVSVMNIDETIKAINDEVKRLEKEENIDKIILLSHVGYGEEGDLKIAQETEGIDIIIGGHSHTNINGVQKENKGEDNLKNLVYSKRNEPVIITQSGSNANYTGNLDVVFDENGILIEDKIKNNIQNINEFNSSKEIDTEIENTLGKNEVLTKVLPSEVPQNEYEERLAENPTANILMDAVLQKAKNMNTEVSLINSASVRGGFNTPSIDIYDVKYSMIPFNDNVGIVDLTEKDFVDLLEKSAITMIEPDKSQLLQVAGMRYEIDFTKDNLDKKGNVIKKIEILNKNNEVTRTINPQNPDNSKTVRCAINQYLTCSNTTKDVMEKYKDELENNNLGDLQNILINYLKSQQSIKAQKDNRIIIQK